MRDEGITWKQLTILPLSLPLPLSLAPLPPPHFLPPPFLPAMHMSPTRTQIHGQIRPHAMDSYSESGPSP
jgi:hypothetical protein